MRHTSWGNADAGYEDADGFAAKLTCGEGNVFDGCVAHNNTDVGFKLGGSNIPGGHRLENSYAFFNRSKGIDSNSCPDVVVMDCVSYNNLRYNVAFYTNIEQDTAYQATGVIFSKDNIIDGGDSSGADNFKPKGKQDLSAFQNDSCYYWDGAHAVNASGNQITADNFVSLEFTGVNRHEDGSIALQGFVQLVTAN